MGVNHGSAVAISIKRRGGNRAKSLDLKALEHRNPKDAMKRAPRVIEVDDESSRMNSPAKKSYFLACIWKVFSGQA